MLHFGDYVFLAIICCSVYMVAVRLLDLLRGALPRSNQARSGVDNPPAGAQQ